MRKRRLRDLSLGLVPPATPASAIGDVDAIKGAINGLRAGEGRTLAIRVQTLATAYAASRWALIVGSVLGLAFALFIVGRTILQLTQERRLLLASATALETALQGAQAAERAKVRFLANMSHEMRTPLNGVVGLSEALSRRDLPPEERELVDGIRFSAATLDHLIGDLLALARGQAPHDEPHAVGEFQLQPTLAAIARPFMTQAKAKALTFEVEVVEDGDVEGDAEAVAQILACLLSNAIKFTARGGVRLTAEALGDDRYRFAVADTGEGFDQGFKAQLFDTFSQIDDSETRQHGGAGLGLALASRVVAALGGTLDAHSTPGVGSTFFFDIPLKDLGREPAAGAETPAAGATNEVEAPLCILIVDDNATNRKVLETILDQVGAAWVSVEDGRQAVEAARGQAFAAILMDIQMPVMDGLTATREIRKLEREAGRAMAPIVIVSANCQPEQVASGKEAGAQRHLGKPVGAQVLIETLNDVLAEAA
jgi:signal transduction histidine kinase/CheY-like chemotaxis protein